MFFLRDHNAVTPVRLKPAALRSRVKHSTTEPPALPHFVEVENNVLTLLDSIVQAL